MRLLVQNGLVPAVLEHVTEVLVLSDAGVPLALAVQLQGASPQRWVLKHVGESGGPEEFQAALQVLGYGQLSVEVDRLVGPSTPAGPLILSG